MSKNEGGGYMAQRTADAKKRKPPKAETRVRCPKCGCNFKVKQSPDYTGTRIQCAKSTCSEYFEWETYRKT